MHEKITLCGDNCLSCPRYGVQKCNQCNYFPCEKISDMLKKSDQYQKKAKEVCSEEEYRQLEAAFLTKEII